MIELTENTKLKDILAEYPNIKSRLPEINPRFSLLSSPMGKIMINKVTIADMSQRSGTELKQLIAKLSELISEEAT